MIWAPRSSRMSCGTALTVPAVPTGMKAGVSTGPCAVWITAWRADPARAWMVKGSDTGISYRIYSVGQQSGCGDNGLRLPFFTGSAEAFYPVNTEKHARRTEVHKCRKSLEENFRRNLKTLAKAFNMFPRHVPLAIQYC